MRRALAPIVVSFLLAILLCLAGCGLSSSDEKTSSSSVTSAEATSDSGDDSSTGSKKSTNEKYTDKASGFTISLPSGWETLSKEDISKYDLDDVGICFLFSYDETPHIEEIACQAISGYGGLSITDFTTQDEIDFFSALYSVEDVSKKKLKSGTYYYVEGTGLENDSYNQVYDIIKNGYEIRYTYSSFDGESNTPHLSDFEDMVDTASYGKSDSTSSSDSKDSKSSSDSKDSKKSSSSKSSKSSSKSKKPDGAIDWSEASNHVGETVTVYGKVKDTDYATSSNGRPTFIDIGASYPDSSRVTAVIWEEYRSAFSSSPETYYEGKTICVTGEIYLYEGVCDIEVTSPGQIEVLD